MRIKIILFVLAIIVLLVSYTYGFNIKNDNARIEFVSHTEYWREDFATTIVRVSDYRGNSLNVEQCRVTILYPDKTVYVDNESLQKSAIEGNWFRYDDLRGSPLGTYEQEVTCYYGGNALISSQSFHLNPALEAISLISKNNLTLYNITIMLSDIKKSQEIVLENAGDIDGLVDVLLEMGQDINANLTLMIKETGTKIEIDMAKQMSKIANESENQIADRINKTISGLIHQSLEEQSVAFSNLEKELRYVLNSSISGNLSMIQGDINRIETLILELQSNCTSKLCGLIGNVSIVLDDVKNRTYTYHQSINSSLSTLNLVMGDLASGIDSVRLTLASLVVRTNEINQTTHMILNRIDGEIQIQVIS
jgi:hypothetical protein